MRQWADHEAWGRDGCPVGEHSRFGPDALTFERGSQRTDRAEPQVIPEDFADQRRLFRHDFQLLPDAAITQWHGSPDPNPLALGGGDLVAHPLPDHLPLELGE